MKKCAPYIAIRCLLQLAQEYQNLYPDAAEVIKSDFYMDDMLMGGDDEQKVAKIAIPVRDILNRANFKLKKWKSNSISILTQ